MGIISRGGGKNVKKNFLIDIFISKIYIIFISLLLFSNILAILYENLNIRIKYEYNNSINSSWSACICP